ncbi:nuclease-related domain-containing protein [Arthrobacter sp. NEB 688]|uniref:nuclease-related domain-containing protein n=1 Tax=Arthrobacter sp. NEB 688 TaxID=904039 RepID=UPI001564A87B|nr:nuclease-related domain-containing protein [Arthrobacter sp. NEB 688]QKE83183.1 NERD domain-containing protein [Arthrobacter sp. NEB 688]
MRLRYAGVCRVCDVQLAAKAEAIYERATKTVRCLEHEGSLDSPDESEASVIRVLEVVNDAPESRPEVVVLDEPVTPEVVDSGVAGASARREFERRKAKREEGIRTRHPKLGGLILAVTDDPQSTRAWDTGAIGEELLGKGLDGQAGDTVRLLHDRRIPCTRANIDHIAVTAHGVVVIDAKRYKGRPSLRVEGGILRPRVEKLMIGSRDCSKLVDGVLKQVALVRDIVGEGVPVEGALCFLDADWPLFGGDFTTRGVQVLWPKKLYKHLQQAGPLDAVAIDALHRRLAAALPPS